MVPLAPSCRKGHSGGFTHPTQAGSCGHHQATPPPQPWPSPSTGQRGKPPLWASPPLSASSTAWLGVWSSAGGVSPTPLPPQLASWPRRGFGWVLVQGPGSECRGRGGREVEMPHWGLHPSPLMLMPGRPCLGVQCRVVGHSPTPPPQLAQTEEGVMATGTRSRHKVWGGECPAEGAWLRESPISQLSAVAGSLGGRALAPPGS